MLHAPMKFTVCNRHGTTHTLFGIKHKGCIVQRSELIYCTAYATKRGAINLRHRPLKCSKQFVSCSTPRGAGSTLYVASSTQYAKSSTQHAKSSTWQEASSTWQGASTHRQAGGGRHAAIKWSVEHAAIGNRDSSRGFLLAKTTLKEMMFAVFCVFHLVRREWWRTRAWAKQGNQGSLLFIQ